MENQELNKKYKKLGRKKVIVNVLIIVCLLLLVFSLVRINDLKKNEKEELPTGGLSQSIFEYQNNEYESESGMHSLYFLFNGHYTYDMYDVQLANEGESTFYKVSPTITVGVTSVSSDYAKQPLERLEEDMLEAFQISSVSIERKEKGYRNGWASEYSVFTGINGESKESIKGVSYVAEIDEGYFIISAFSNQETYQSINTECIKIYDTVHVSDEWIRRNVPETEKMFVPEETTNGIKNETESETLE